MLGMRPSRCHLDRERFGFSSSEAGAQGQTGGRKGKVTTGAGRYRKGEMQTRQRKSGLRCIWALWRTRQRGRVPRDMSRLFQEAGWIGSVASSCAEAGALAAGSVGGRFSTKLATTIAPAVAMPAPTAQNDRLKMNMAGG